MQESRDLSSRPLELLRWTLLLGGVALFVSVLYRGGYREICRDAWAQGWAILPYIVLSGLENSFHTLSCLRCVSPAHRGAFPWWRMFLLYHMAYAINSSTPSGEVGGEVARGLAMSRHIPGDEAASAVLVNKFTFSIAQMAVAASLTGITLVAFHLDPARAWVLALGAGLTGLGLVIFAVVQSLGLLGRTLTVLARIAGKKAQQAMRARAGELDERLKSIYRDRKRDLLASVGLDMLGFLVGVLQRSFLIGAVLGFHTFSPGRLLLVGSAVWGVTTLAEMIFFFVVGRLGVREGSYQAAFQAVGLPGEKGVVLSVIGRVDQLFWTAVGFAAYWHLLLRNPSPRPVPVAVASPVPK